MTRRITLLNEKFARIGYRFVFEGAAQACSECRYYKVCIQNLEQGRVYEVKEVRDRRLECKAYGITVVPVVVVEPDIEALIDKRIAIEGAIITFNYPNCNELNCPNYKKCFPKGLKNGDKVRILEVRNTTERFPCGQSLVHVKLRRIS